VISKAIAGLPQQAGRECCTNCHFETLLKESKRISIPVSGWVFLMYCNGKVNPANIQTYVVLGRKTFLAVACVAVPATSTSRV
jgi:hypothetical protein